MKELAPIVLFVYNRPRHTELTLNALMKNILADQSVLHIYSDGPKNESSAEQLQLINSVRRLIRKKKWCKVVHIIEASNNKGLANSIIDGVTKIVNQYGKIIVLEDDIVTSPGFLQYMNDALLFYEQKENVYHVSGYMYPHTSKLPETFFFNVPLCWGWATWKRAWCNFNVNTTLLMAHFDNAERWAVFNKFGRTFLEDQLRENLTGGLNTWFIKWHASVMIKNGLCLYPSISLVNNIGFDGTGIHNGSIKSIQHVKLAISITVAPIPFIESKSAEEIVKHFYNELFFHNSSYNKFQSTGKAILLFKAFNKQLKRLTRKILFQVLPELSILNNNENNWDLLRSVKSNTVLGKSVFVYKPYQLYDIEIGDYSYIAQNAILSKTTIGKFCSIGPNLLCGWGIHPVDGISTSPMFYSTLKQNGSTLSQANKVEERKHISIGNDVFIGANVTILDGVSIGHGAVIGAGAVVSKDIPPYAIAIGNPIKVIRYRFKNEQVEALMRINWWDFEEAKLREVEKFFFDIDAFISKYLH
jgi:acetyltransferase-like isoleucine patch superfamily enzyme